MASEIRSNATRVVKGPFGLLFGSGAIAAAFSSSLGKALKPVANSESKGIDRDEEKKDLPNSIAALHESKPMGFFGSRFATTMDTLNKLVEERNEYKPCHGCGPKS